MLKKFGVPFEVLDRDGCVGAEPALGLVRDKFAGGLRLPGDETGDCFKFTQELRGMAEALGVTFRYGVESAASSPMAAGSPAWRRMPGELRPTPMCWRSAAIRRCC